MFSGRGKTLHPFATAVQISLNVGSERKAIIHLESPHF